ELEYFTPYMESGKLMSCAGLRYARELDEARANLEQYGDINLISGTILLNWEKYGIHMLEAALGTCPDTPIQIFRNTAPHESFNIEMQSGRLLRIDCLGKAPITFQMDIFGTTHSSQHHLRDNFSAFKRLLTDFVTMLETGKPTIDPEKTITIIKTMIAGNKAQPGGAGVKIHDKQ